MQQVTCQPAFKDDGRTRSMLTDALHNADWVGFVALFSTSVVLCYKLLLFRPPLNTEAGKTTLYYFGTIPRYVISNENLWILGRMVEEWGAVY